MASFPTPPQPHNQMAGQLIRQLLMPQRSPYINWYAGQDAQDHSQPSSQQPSQGGGLVNPYLQAAIQALHEAMLHDNDPVAVATLSKCQAALTALQKEQSQPQQTSGRGAIQSRMSQ